MGIRTAEGLLEAYVFEEHMEGGRIDEIKQTFARTPGVQFVGQFVGSFSLFARVVAADLSELQNRIKTEYWEAGIHSSWSLNLTASSAAAPKRASPDICALVCARAQGDPFEIWEALDASFLRKDEGEGAAVVNARDFDLLVDLGAHTIEDVIDRVSALRAFDGIGRTSTAFANLADNAIRPPKS
jgi:hypothetical protein